MSGKNWFYVLIGSMVVMGITLGIQRYFDLQKTQALKAVVGVCIVAIAVSLLGFLSRVRD